VVIAGPTAVGKTDLAIKLAKHYGTKIISADSRQFYREMNIGTAKPTEKQLAQVEHFFVGNLSVHNSYNVGEYEKEVIPLLDRLFKLQDIVFLVGGSGLYINAVLYGVDEFLEVSDEVKARVAQSFAENGLEWLQSELEKLDPDYYNEVDKNNPQRLMRALEVCIQSGKRYSSFITKNKKQRNFEAIKILINTDRDTLYERINKRTDQMMEEGFLDEAKKLHIHKQRNALNTVGYKELFDHLSGNTALEKAVDLIKQKTRNYAKRQLTWFNNQDEYQDFGPDDFEKIKAYIDIITQH
jgi:tRNA dimethylallyltransferase